MNSVRPPSGFTTRFAPAPTGYLHLGHAVNALWVWGLARAFDGRVLLRIEDHDRGRCRAEYEVAILDDLDWLGLVPDGTAADAFRRGPVAQRQSDNTARYAARLSDLASRDLVYACDCSRADIARVSAERTTAHAGPDVEGAEQRYPGTCRTAAHGGDAVVARRLRVAPGAPESFDDLRLGPQTQDPDLQCGDLLLRDRNGNWTYQFAVVVDDLEQDVDVVIRGEDLLQSTGRQLRLARLLGRRDMPQFLHHPLVRQPDGRKLSKSDGATGLRELRAAGRSPSEVLGLAAQLSGLQLEPHPVAPAELATLFRGR